MALSSPAAATRAKHQPEVRQLYLALSQRSVDAAPRAAAGDWLRAQLDGVGGHGAGLPRSAEEFGAWSQAHTDAVGAQYRQYLAERKAGAPRRYFGTRSHALYFLKGVAPTKLVDGAWLYGLLQRWDEAAMRPLITTYLEELGNGVPEQNHVLIYRQLIETHGCDQWQTLPDQHFVQGLIQLAFASHAEQFLPELIGYNLGYEQLPLHLLITAYELNELGIDPYYFTLHVTIDNADTGHARKAWEAAQKLMPQVGDSESFARRMANGYRLNELGAGTLSVIASFDLQAELIGILRAKSVVGKNMHADYCKVGGRALNDWLADPQQMPALLAALEQQGWFTRGAAPEDSRFWRLIQGDHAQMFGVFSAYEQQVLHDWIAGASDSPALQRVPTHRARQRAGAALGMTAPRQAPEHAERALIRHRFPDDEHAWETIDSELRLLEAKLAASDSKEEAIALLTGLMAPASHHTGPGMMATRIFSKLLA